jgi:hypothetical protein
MLVEELHEAVIDGRISSNLFSPLHFNLPNAFQLRTCAVHFAIISS